jgi:predicted nicotinamide N-methyase
LNVELADLRSLISRHTRIASVPLLPEIRLHLASEAFALWKDTEAIRGPGSPMPYWAFAWSGGQALARYILDNPQSLVGRTVLDVGTGSGLVGIAAAMAGAAHVRASDPDPIALAAVTINAGLNAVCVEPAAGDIFACDDSDDDVVLAGDVFYEREMSRWVLRFLEQCAARGATVLAGDAGREFFPRPQFRRLAEYPVLVMTAVEEGTVKTTGVWSLDARAPAISDVGAGLRASPRSRHDST